MSLCWFTVCSYAQAFRQMQQQQHCMSCISHEFLLIIYFLFACCSDSCIFLGPLAVTHGGRSRTRRCSTHAAVLHGRVECVMRGGENGGGLAGWGWGDAQVGSHSSFCHLVAGEMSEDVCGERRRAASLSHGDIFIL